MSKIDFNTFDDFFNDESFFWLELKRGRKEGLEKLYQKFSKELFRYGMLIKPNRAFVQDCIQDLFVDLWKYKENLSSTENVRSYLLKCLRTKISKGIQKDRKFTENVSTEDHAKVFMIDSIEENLIELEQSEGLISKLRYSLTKLPFRQREIIHYLFFEKLTYEETSLRLGIQMESCYTLAWKAIRKLRDNMQY